MAAIIERNVDAQLRSREEQAFLLRVLTDRVDERLRANPRRDRLPGFAVITGAINVGSEIVEPMALHGDVRHGGIEARRLDHGDLAPVADAVRRNVLPGLPAIQSEMEQASVAARPYLGGFQGRRRDALHHAEATFLRVLYRDWPGSLIACGVRRSTREVGTDLLPVQATVGGFHDVLRSQIERVLLKRREDKHRRPGVAIFALVDLAAKVGRWPWSDVLAQRGAAVPANHAAIDTGGIKNIGITGVGREPSAFASADHKPVTRGNQPVIGSTHDRRAAAVLLRAVNVIGEPVVGDYVIELPDRLVVPGGPRLAVVETDGCALIGANYHARSVLGIDPELVVVVAARRAAHDGDGLAGILRAIERDIRNVDHVGIAGVDGYPVEIPSPAGEASIVVGERPRVAAIVRAIEAGLLACIQQGIHTLAVRSYSNTDPSPISIRQSMAGQLCPGGSAVARAIQSSARPLQRGIGAPRRTVRVPRAGKQNIRSTCRDGEVGDANGGPFVEHVSPGVSAVDRLVNPALVVGAIGVPQHSDVDSVRVVRIDDDATDLAGIMQADIFPGRAAVQRLVYSVARGEIGAYVRLAGARIHDIRI